ncbi:MAG: MMPL family transporter [Elusimicrobia bacterium]|nr:MMPL family transporter [Elusimicrobiota bacterium]
MLRDVVVHRLSGWIAEHPRKLILGAVLIGGFFAYHLPRLQARADMDDFFASSEPTFILHQSIKKLYPRNDFFSLAYQSPRLFTPEGLKDLVDLTEQIESLPNIKEVVSLANVGDMRGTNDVFETKPFLAEFPSDEAALKQLQVRAINKPLYRNVLISSDGTATAIAVFLPEDSARFSRRRALKDVEKIIAPYTARGYQFHLAGWPVTSVRLVEFMNQDVARFLPITMILVLGTIWFVFRNFRLLGLAGLGVVMTVTATLGLASYFEIPLNIASVAVIPLVMALALSDIVHVFSHLDRSVLSKYPNRREALKHVVEQILFPCLITTLNTAIGFLTFTTNSVPAIRNFGGLAAAGMMFEFLFTFGLVTPLLLFFNPAHLYRDTTQHKTQELPRLVGVIHRFVSRRPVWALTFCFAALAWGGWQMRKVQVETDLSLWFNPRTALRQDVEFIRNHIGGFQTMMVEFQSEPGAFKDPGRLAAVERLATALATIPGVDHVSSVVDYFKEMNGAFHAEDPIHYRLPKTRGLLEQYLLLYDADDLNEVVTPGFDRTRILLRLQSSSSRRNKETLTTVRRMTETFPVPNTQTVVCGGAVDHVHTSRILVTDQIANIAQAVGGIWLVMFVVLRSAGMAALFLVPNLFPIILNFGIMGAFGIAIDTGTALIAATAFGIIVDDTVHFFTRFTERRRQGWDYFHALNDVTTEKGEAALSSAVILAMGFGVLTLSHFSPIVSFGILNVVVLSTGMIGDLFFLKALMVLGGRRRSVWGAEKSHS